MLLVHLFVCLCVYFVSVISFVLFLFLLVSGVAVCDCGTAWTFLLIFLKKNARSCVIGLKKVKVPVA